MKVLKLPISHRHTYFTLFGDVAVASPYCTAVLSNAVRIAHLVSTFSHKVEPKATFFFHKKIPIEMKVLKVNMSQNEPTTPPLVVNDIVHYCVIPQLIIVDFLKYGELLQL